MAGVVSVHKATLPALRSSIGETLEIVSRAYLRATAHRVRTPQAGFLDLRRHPAKECIFAGYGRNAGKSRLRAHPDVAAAHRYV